MLDTLRRQRSTFGHLGEPDLQSAEPELNKSTLTATFLTAILLSSVLLSGFLNLIPLASGGLYVATLVSDIAVAIMLIALFGSVVHKRAHVRAPAWIIATAVLAASYATLTAFGTEALAPQFADIRTRVGYLIPAVYIHTFIRDRRPRMQLLNYATFLAAIAAVIGIAQQFLAASLPEWLLAAPGESKFTYVGTEILRANGLVGNTIVFSALMLLFMSVCLARGISGSAPINLALTALFAGAILSSYSRVAIVSIPFVTALVVGMSARSRRHQNGRRTGAVLAWATAGTLVVCMVVAAFGGTDRLVENSFLSNGLFDGSNSSVQGSTSRHYYQIDQAANAFLSNPLTGVGVATQRLDSDWSASHAVITDGALWLLLAEGGLLAGLPTLALLLSCAIVLWRARFSRDAGWLAVAVSGFYAVQLFFGSIFNSAILGKVVIVCGAILFGLVASAPETEPFAPETRERNLYTLRLAGRRHRRITWRDWPMGEVVRARDPEMVYDRSESPIHL